MAEDPSPPATKGALDKDRTVAKLQNSAGYLMPNSPLIKALSSSLSSLDGESIIHRFVWGFMRKVVWKSC